MYGIGKGVNRMSEITRSEFNQFVEVRDGGHYNMFDPSARAETTLSKEQWIAIMRNFEALDRKFNAEAS